MKSSLKGVVTIRAVMCISMAILFGLQLTPWSNPATVHAEELNGIWMDWVQYESGGDYAQTGGDGGVSYGRYQYHVNGSLPNFMYFCMERQPESYEAFAGYVKDSEGRHTLTTDKGLGDVWVAACSSEEGNFAALQDQFLLEAYYIPVEQQLLELYNIDLEAYGPVLRGTVLSVALRDGQHVSKTKKYNNLRSVTGTYYEGIPEQDWLNAIYDAEAARHPKQSKRWQRKQKELAQEALLNLIVVEE